MPNNNQEQVGNAINSIPFGNIIGGPLAACIVAQADATKTTLDFIKSTSMEKSVLAPDSYEPVTVAFTFQIEGVKKVMVVPLLTIIPIPYISIEHVDLSFTANITASQNNKIEAHYTSPLTNTDQEDETKVEFENLISVDIHATTADMPSGLAKLLDVFNNQLIQVDVLDTEDLKKEKEAYKRAIKERNKKLGNILAAIKKARLTSEQEGKPEGAPQKPQPEKPKPTKPKPTEPKPTGQTTSSTDVFTSINTELPEKELKEEFLQTYNYYLNMGAEQEVKIIRSEMKKILGARKAAELLRRNKLQNKQLPFLMRPTKKMVEHENCEFDPSKSIRQNIENLAWCQESDDNMLRSHLIFALETARQIYPSNSSSVLGKNRIAANLKKFKNRENGWYTYGKADIQRAFTSFVDSVIANEKKLYGKK